MLPIAVAHNNNIIMTLELKHLAPYLPYKLKQTIANDNIQKEKMTGYHLSEFRFYYLNNNRKPILRPLSDLSKKKQIAEYYCSFYDHLERINPSTSETQNCALMLDGSVEFQYWNDYQFLLEHHFDIFGLIEKGLAVNYNDL